MIPRIIVVLVVSFLLPGCETLEGISSEIPYPQSTPFDSDPDLKAQFLRGFEVGYQQTKRRKGQFSIGSPNDPDEDPWLMGIFAGLEAGGTSKRELKRIRNSMNSTPPPIIPQSRLKQSNQPPQTRATSGPV